MKNTLIIITALFFSISFYAQQSEQLFEIIDNDGNQKIEKNEFKNYIASFENEWDINKDKEIDKNEFKTVYLDIVHTQHQSKMNNKGCEHAVGEPCKRHKEMGHKDMKHSDQDKNANRTFTNDKTSERMDSVYGWPYNYAEAFYDTVYNAKDWHVSDNTDANYDESTKGNSREKMRENKVAHHAQKAFKYWDKDDNEHVSNEEMASHLFQMIDDNNNAFINENEFKEYASLFLGQTAMN